MSVFASVYVEQRCGIGLKLRQTLAMEMIGCCWFRAFDFEGPFHYIYLGQIGLKMGLKWKPELDPKLYRTYISSSKFRAPHLQKLKHACV